MHTTAAGQRAPLGSSKIIIIIQYFNLQSFVVEDWLFCLLVEAGEELCRLVNVCNSDE